MKRSSARLSGKQVSYPNDASSLSEDSEWEVANARVDRLNSVLAANPDLLPDAEEQPAVTDAEGLDLLESEEEEDKDEESEDEAGHVPGYVRGQEIQLYVILPFFASKMNDHLDIMLHRLYFLLTGTAL